MADETETDRSLEPQRLAEMLEAGGVELVDVRRDYEWEAGRIPDARHIEMNELTAAGDSIPKDGPVVFYCRAGNRSSMAAEAFAQAGWDAHNLAGGIAAWSERDLPLDPADGSVAEVLPPS